MKRRLRLLFAVFSLGALLVPAAHAGSTSCLGCHGDAEFFGAEALQLVLDVKGSVHGAVGLSCHDCHGGNPDPALSDDPTAAMDPDFAKAPYVGAPARSDVPGFCGRCHSDPGFMRRFKPDARVDQEREYRGSHHGEALARGDTKVATCVDCHGSHGIRRIDDPLAPVHPTRIAETCAACHADPERMAGYRLDDGRPLPVDQYARWRESSHAAALLEKEDLSAPTCNDCHGNHGAAPPGLDSIAFVCGQCHPREAEIFRASPKREGFQRHNEYLAAVGGAGCVACHETSPLGAEHGGLRSFGECSTCHGAHAVVRPTMAMFALLPETPCYNCHEGPATAPEEVPELESTRRRYALTRDQLLDAASQLGVEGDDRYNWLVDRAQALPFHTTSEGELRPEFGRLFSKFRIGKTTVQYVDPRTGETTEAPITRCNDCHVRGMGPGPGNGLRTGIELLTRMQELTALTARAERILLAARRSGVPTRSALLEVDRAVDAQIELEALVHGFSAAPGSDFARKQQEGLVHARAALVAGQRALDELSARRRGLAAYLVVIFAVLVALGLKIRSAG